MGEKKVVGTQESKVCFSFPKEWQFKEKLPKESFVEKGDK